MGRGKANANYDASSLRRPGQEMTVDGILYGHHTRLHTLNDSDDEDWRSWTYMDIELNGDAVGSWHLWFNNLNGSGWSGTHRWMAWASLLPEAWTEPFPGSEQIGGSGSTIRLEKELQAILNLKNNKQLFTEGIPCDIKIVKDVPVGLQVSPEHTVDVFGESSTSLMAVEKTMGTCRGEWLLHPVLKKDYYHLVYVLDGKPVGIVWSR